MKSRILGLRVASTVFALVCLAQLLRVVLKVEVVAGGHRLPFWPSVVVFVFTGCLSVWLWKLSASKRD
ncbi:MAG TPA: hypothetical protein VK581_11965 [Chthoniobacterales bacterium]|nr:hypothetical protein [Chthoniobacterales bacterium]